MAQAARRRELGRGDRVLPGVWRLRLPLPWPGVPHCNAWALAAGDGIVLVDTGMHEPGSMAPPERAPEQVNPRLENVPRVLCPPAHPEPHGPAPSDVCLFQAQRRLLVSGDHLLGRVSLFYDYGWTPDPAGEFLDSLEQVDRLGARLCLPGHGRPFADVHGLVRANRELVEARIAAVADALAVRPRTPF